MPTVNMNYQVKIDIFEGPLDLLLHLIQKNDLEIVDIPIAQITTEYLSYLDLMQELNLSLAGEFLVMATTLMQIKARMLLPSDQTAEGEGPDPRAELVQRLLEYQKFKSAAQTLGSRFDLHRDIYYRGAPLFSHDDQTLDLDLSKLVDAFQNVLNQSETTVRDILIEEIPVEVRIREILDVLETKSFVAFHELFPVTAARNTLVVTFLALLELIRLHQVRVAQAANFGEIHISKIQEAEKAVTLI